MEMERLHLQEYQILQTKKKKIIIDKQFYIKYFILNAWHFVSILIYYSSNKNK